MSNRVHAERSEGSPCVRKDLGHGTQPRPGRLDQQATKPWSSRLAAAYRRLRPHRALHPSLGSAVSTFARAMTRVRRRPHHHLLAAAIVVVLLMSAAPYPISASNAQAVPNQLDPTYGDGGLAKGPVGEGLGWTSAALQPDHKMVVVGSAYVGENDQDVLVTRYNHDGSLDTDFAGDGTVTTPISTVPTFPLDSAEAVTIQPDGKILVAATTYSGTTNDPASSNPGLDFAVIRYLANGQLDPAFDSDGIVVTTFPDQPGTWYSDGYRDIAHDIAVQSDGKIVVAGTTNLYSDFSSSPIQFGLVRYDDAGALDTSFGTGGRVITAIHGNESEARAIAIQPDGRIIAGGTTGTDEFALVRYQASGVPDPNFGIGGRVTTQGQVLKDIALQADGKIVAAGYDWNNGQSQLVRFEAAGFVDKYFGDMGAVTTEEVGTWESIAIQPQAGDRPEMIVAAGGSQTGDFALGRFKLSGQPDETFGEQGIVVTDVGGYDQAVALGVQSDGKLVAAGTSTDYETFDQLVLARYLSEPQVCMDISEEARNFTAVGNGWSMQGEITDDDGLVVRDLMLKNRYIAESVSLPYAKLQLLGLPPKRLELEPRASGPYRSCLTSFAVIEPRLPTSPLVVAASYRFTDVSDSELIVEQRYEFYREVDEGNDDPILHCEPSHEAPGVVPDPPFDMTCARWMPMVSYKFLPGGQDTLVDFEVVQRLHLQPDHRPLRGAALMRDCEVRESGTAAEPCWIPSLPSDTTGLVSPAPPHNPVLEWQFLLVSAPGIRLKDDTVALQRETLEEVLVNGKPNRFAPYDNVHVTNAATVDLPIPFPPGCPECLHFHWRWADYFKGDQYGHGMPLLPPNSDQDVTIGLLNGNSLDWDPADFRSLFDPTEPLGPSPWGPILWHAATGHQLQDTFFGYGGFASSLEFERARLPVDIEILDLWASEVEEVVAPGQRYWYTAYFQNKSPNDAWLPRVTFTLPNGLEFVPDVSRTVPERPRSCSQAGGRTVVCEYGDAFDPLLAGQTNTLWIQVEVVGPAGLELMGLFAMKRGA